MSLIDRLQNAINSTQAERDSWEQQGYFHHYNNAVGQIEAYEDCIQMITDAITPRPPQAEWFGTGPGQWDAWMTESGRLLRNGRWFRLPGCKCHYPNGRILFNGESVEENVVPVAREGYPAPVGWQVVEMKS